ncbi:helix-turn-helix domain-containing protein [Streptomyces smyrnaeus]|uniref:Helix-turn-helix domain-containing protein n=1 Tax=Streptomyces smyrnaeus TaxID=1387713 RepID=A0ABS3XQJ0_9ACTN|nr:helix-turn-helix transcriptional regulator [Streptomyces smyrnaeus]MBO8197685.1 helix-turn-helix domain-containing protein [Streptomyces smyrnaeus]
MPESSDTHIGTRLREARKRAGLTQRGLASASGVSVSLIRKLEQQEVQETRLETARALAVALRVPTSALLRRDDGMDDAEPVGPWEQVRAALTAPRQPSDVTDAEPTARGLGAALRATEPLFAGDRFAELAVVLPHLLRDADALDDEEPHTRAIRGRLLQLTGWLLTQNRQFEAANHALDRAQAEATDRLDGAATATIQCWLLLRTGRVGEARELAERWADETEPRLSRATADELASWGWLMLRVSAASVRDARQGQAADALRMASAAAAALGREHSPEGDWLRTFGPTTVVLKAAEHEAVTGRPDRVLAASEQVPLDELPRTSNNRNRHLLDVADAHARLRRYGEAVDVLREIQAASPQWLPQQRYARDILGRIVRRRRTLTPEMRGLADAVRLPL